MRVDVKTGFKCNNSCVFCTQENNKQFGNKTLEEVKRELKESSLRCDEAVLTGGEVTIRDDFLEIVKFAKELDYKIIQVQSNGRKFSDIELCKKAIEAGANEFSISIHGEKDSHNILTGDDGFDDTEQAIINLIGLGQTVITNTVVNSKNYTELKKIATMLINLNVSQIQLSMIHSSNDNLVPKFASIRSYVHDAIDLARNNNITITTEAIPYCFMQGYEEHIAENSIPVTEVKGKDFDENFTETRIQKGKTKFEKCIECKHFFDCEGVWKEFLEVHGENEFVPILNVPEEVKIELTNRCNFNCDFCFQNKNGKDMNKDEILAILDQIKKSNIPAVRFTGGEPFLREDLFELVKYGKDIGLHTILNTNASLIKDYSVFDYVDECLISFHNLENIDSLRKVIKQIKFYGVTTRLATILTKGNILKLSEFFEGAKYIDPDVYSFLRQVPNQENPSPLSKEDVIDATNKIIELNKQYNYHVFIANSVPFCVDDRIKSICVGGRHDSGYTKIVIDSLGNIKSDYFSDIILGNIKNTKIIDAWKMIKRDYSGLPDKCHTCTYMKICKGGLVNDGLFDLHN